jgi:hypothetical protein
MRHLDVSFIIQWCVFIGIDIEYAPVFLYYRLNHFFPLFDGWTCNVIREMKYFKFRVAVTLGAETILFGICAITLYVCSKHDDLSNLDL